MAHAWADLNQQPAYGVPAVNGKAPLYASATITIGDNGAVEGVSGAPGITAAKDSGAAGTYDITFPPCKGVRIFPALYSPGLTVDAVVITDLDAEAGEATIVTVALTEDEGDYAREAVNPAADDTILLLFDVEQ